ncbi:MAG: hypothetical protein ACFFBD_24445 [Candidatus Hodarchaeota archaeon]
MSEDIDKSVEMWVEGLLVPTSLIAGFLGSFQMLLLTIYSGGQLPFEMYRWISRLLGLLTIGFLIAMLSVCCAVGARLLAKAKEFTKNPRILRNPEVLLTLGGYILFIFISVWLTFYVPLITYWLIDPQLYTAAGIQWGYIFVIGEVIIYLISFGYPIVNYIRR